MVSGHDVLTVGILRVPYVRRMKIGDAYVKLLFIIIYAVLSI